MWVFHLSSCYKVCTVGRLDNADWENQFQVWNKHYCSNYWKVYFFSWKIKYRELLDVKCFSCIYIYNNLLTWKKEPRYCIQYFSGFSPVKQGCISPLRTSIHVYSYFHEFKLPDGLTNGSYLHCAWKLTISKFSYMQFRDSCYFG